MPRKSQKNLKQISIHSKIERGSGLLTDSRLEKLTEMRTRAWISSILTTEMGKKISYRVHYKKLPSVNTSQPIVQCFMQLTSSTGYVEARTMDRDPLRALRLCLKQIGGRVHQPEDEKILLPSGVVFAAAG